MVSLGTFMWGMFWPVGMVIAAVLTLRRFKREGVREGTEAAEQVMDETVND